MNGWIQICYIHRFTKIWPLYLLLISISFPPAVADYLLALTRPHFYPWELGDMSVPRMRDINAGLSQCALAADLLHRAAYRDRGLGMSQYAPNHMVRILLGSSKKCVIPAFLLNLAASLEQIHEDRNTQNTS